MHLQTLLKSEQHDKEFLYEMINILFRTTNNEVLAKVIDDLLNKYTLGDCFSATQKALFWIFQHSTKNIPDVSIPFLKEYIKQECRKLLVDEFSVYEHLEKLDFQEKKAIITFLEPMALYEEEALKVVEKYIQILANENVHHISINMTTIEPKINFLTYNGCLIHLENKFSMILRHAIKYASKNKVAKFVYFEVNNDTFNQTFETLNKIVLKDEFLSSRIGFSFKLNEFNNVQYLKKIVDFSNIVVALGGEKITIRLEDTHFDFQTNSHFQMSVHWLLKKEHEDTVHVVINTYNTYHIELINVMISKNQLENMVEFESFMGFQSMNKTSHLVYSPIVSFDDFSKGIEYILEKIKPKPFKTIFYDFGSKNIIYFSNLSQKEESLENILEKIYLVYEKSCSLDLELLIHEELCEDTEFCNELFRSIKSMFICANSNAHVELENNVLEISIDEFKGTIVLKRTKNIDDVIAYIKVQSGNCAHKIYTLYKEEELSFYNRINS